MDCSDLSPEEHEALRLFTQYRKPRSGVVKNIPGTYPRRVHIDALLEMGFLLSTTIVNKQALVVQIPCACKVFTLEECKSPGQSTAKEGGSHEARQGRVSCVRSMQVSPANELVSDKSPSNLAGPKSIRYDKAPNPLPAFKRKSVKRMVWYFKSQCHIAESVSWPKRTCSPQGLAAIGKLVKGWYVVGATEQEVREVMDTFFRDVVHTPPPDKVELWRAFIARRDYWTRNIGKKKAPGDDATREEQEDYWLGKYAKAFRRSEAALGDKPEDQ